MAIRDARPEDLDGIVAIEERAFPERLRWTREDLLHQIVQSRVLVYPVDLRIVGYVAWKILDDIGNLNSVGVLPEYQGRGFGMALVEEAKFRMEGAACVELDCDEHLERFYRVLGFERCGSYTSGIGEKQVRRLVMRWVP